MCLVTPRNRSCRMRIYRHKPKPPPLALSPNSDRLVLFGYSNDYTYSATKHIKFIIIIVYCYVKKYSIVKNIYWGCVTYHDGYVSDDNVGWTGSESGTDVSGCVSIIRDGRDSLSLSFYYYAWFHQRYCHLLSVLHKTIYMLCLSNKKKKKKETRKKKKKLYVIY